MRLPKTTTALSSSHCNQNRAAIRQNNAATTTSCPLILRWKIRLAALVRVLPSRK